MLFAAILLGFVLGLVTGGRLANLLNLRFRWPWLILPALFVRPIILFTPLDRINGPQWIYLAALLVVVLWTVLNVQRVRGMWLIAIGAALNGLVIAANGARMPVAPEFASALVRQGTIGQYTVMGPHTNLNLLGDWIQPYPLHEADSVGDVLIAVGLAIVVFLALRNPRRYPNKELTPP